MNQRMMTTLVKTFLCVFFAANLAGHAFAEVQGGSPKAAFEKLKALAGKWQGTTDQEGRPVEVHYRVTAGNSAIFETLFPNTDHEMVTAYHLDSGRLVATHYCMVGNQPRMALDPKKSTDERLFFDFVGGSNMDPAKDMHIHKGWIHFKGGDQIEAEWTAFAEGKPAHSTKFLLSRKK